MKNPMPAEIEARRKAARRVVEYGSCSVCPTWSIGITGNGRIVRHSAWFGSVEKVGPGTRHPMRRNKICEGSGEKVVLSDDAKRRLEMLIEKLIKSEIQSKER